MHAWFLIPIGAAAVFITVLLHDGPPDQHDLEHVPVENVHAAGLPSPQVAKPAAGTDIAMAKQSALEETLQDELDSLDYGDATQSERLQIERRATQFILFRNGLMNLSPKSAPPQEVTRLRNMTFELEKADVFDYEEGQRYRNYLDRMR